MKARLVYVEYAGGYEVHIRLLGFNLLIVPVRGERNIIGTHSLTTWPLAIDEFQKD